MRVLRACVLVFAEHVHVCVRHLYNHNNDILWESVDWIMAALVAIRGMALVRSAFRCVGTGFSHRLGAVDGLGCTVSLCGC